MRPDSRPRPVCRNAVCLKTPHGEHLVMDPTAKLEQGCTVAVLLSGCFMLVGRLERKPTVDMRLVISCRDVQGNERVTRVWGLRTEGVQVWRVLGVLNDI